MKPSDRVKFLRLRRRADALKLRALEAEQVCRDLRTRLREAERQIETVATTQSVSGLIAFGAGGSGGAQSARAGSGGFVWPGVQ